LMRNSDKTDLIAKFLIFKKSFPNSVIYNYNPTRAHKTDRLPFSRNTIHTSVEDMIAEGWAEKVGPHLRFKSKIELYVKTVEEQLREYLAAGKRAKKWKQNRINSLKKKLRRLKPLCVKLSSTQNQSLSDELKFQSLHSLSKRNVLTKGATIRGTKYKYSRQKSSGKSKNLVFHNGLSYSVVAKLFGVSKTTAFEIINKLLKHSALKKIRSKPTFHGKDRHLLLHIPNAFLTRKGYVCTVDPNNYVFNREVFMS